MALGPEFLDVFEAIKERRSVRSFLERVVSRSDLIEIIESGMSAPSAGNMQSWEFVIVRDPIRKRALGRASFHQEFIAKAPVVIVVLANQFRSASVYGARGAQLYAIQDTSAAVENMLLAAHGMSLGACWVEAFNEDAASRIVKATKHVKPVAIVPLGYPDRFPDASPRKPVSEVIHEEEYVAR